MKTTHETIAVEGGEAGTPNQRHKAQDRVYDLLHQAVKHIPRLHRTGWYHAIARYAGRPLTPTPNRAEREYLAWSAARHTNPRQTP